MDIQKLRDTDDFEPGKSNRHGRVIISKRDNILLYNASGPFNDELIDAVAAISYGLIREMSDRGQWAEIVTFNRSVLAPLNVLKSLEFYLSFLISQNFIAHVSAVVLPPEIQGRDIALPFIVNAYEANNMTVKIFENSEAAMEWITTELGAQLHWES